jgi:hypothetical protein
MILQSLYLYSLKPELCVVGAAPLVPQLPSATELLLGSHIAITGQLLKFESVGDALFEPEKPNSLHNSSAEPASVGVISILLHG